MHIRAKSAVFPQDFFWIKAMGPNKILPPPVGSKEGKIVGVWMIAKGRGDRRITVFPIGKIPLLCVEDFFAGVETIPMTVVGENNHLRIIHNLNVVMPRQ
jgi:hypothetical protein